MPKKTKYPKLPDKFEKVHIGTPIPKPFYQSLCLISYRDNKSKAEILRTLIRKYLRDVKDFRGLKIDIAKDIVKRWYRRKKAFSGRDGWITDGDIEYQWEKHLKDERADMRRKHIPERTCDVILKEVRERR
jgi:predicted DNA-binding protein